MLPKYFENLKLAVSAITGQPRIVKINPKNPDRSDKYIDIPHDEFKNIMLNYFF